MPNREDIVDDIDAMLEDWDEATAHPGAVWPHLSDRPTQIFGRLFKPSNQRSFGDVSLNTNDYTFLTSQRFANGLIRDSVLIVDQICYQVVAVKPGGVQIVIVVLKNHAR